MQRHHAPCHDTMQRCPSTCRWLAQFGPVSHPLGVCVRHLRRPVALAGRAAFTPRVAAHEAHNPTNHRSTASCTVLPHRRAGLAPPDVTLAAHLGHLRARHWCAHMGGMERVLGRQCLGRVASLGHASSSVLWSPQAPEARVGKLVHAGYVAPLTLSVEFLSLIMQLALHIVVPGDLSAGYPAVHMRRAE